MTRIAPHTGFGDDPETAIRFAIQRESGYRVADWSGGPRLSVKTIGSSVAIRNMGRDPYRVTWTLRLPDRAQFARLDAAQGTSATLRYPYGVTRDLDGDHERIAGVDYLILPATRLLTIGEPVIQADGQVEVTATFLRPYAGGAS